MKIDRLVSLGALAVIVAATACGAAQTGSAVPATPIPVAKGATSCGRLHSPTTTPTPITGVRVGSTIALATLNQQTLAYTADEDDNAVHVVDVDAHHELGETALDGRPSQLMFLPDGRLAVLLRDRAQIAVLEPGANAGDLETRCTVDVANEPVALALTPNDATLLVTSGWGRALSAFDASKLTKSFEVPLAREPRAVIVSDDGRFAYVSHAVGAQASRVALADKAVTPIMLREKDPGQEIMRRQLQKQIAEATKNGGAAPPWVVSQLEAMDKRAHPSCQGYALAKSVDPGGRILAPQVLVDNGEIEQRAQGYGNDQTPTEEADVAVIDATTGVPMASSLERTQQRGGWGIDRRTAQMPECILPRAAVVDPKTKSLFVSCLGIDEVVAYDSLAANPARAERRRWPVSSGPNGIALESAKNRAVVWSQFDRAVDVIDLGNSELHDDKGGPGPATVRVVMAPNATHKLSPALALGRLLFHSVGDGRVARDGRACASCHPDGRDDSLVWATPEGPRRSIMLAGRLEGTAPYSWSGREADLRAHLTTTFDRLNGSGGGLKSLELEALLVYVESLAPPSPSSRGSGNDRDVKVQQGAAFFASPSVGCAGCHSGALATDNRRHDVGSKTDADRSGEFNTPSLHLVSGAGPYFHDGRYKTLHEVLIQPGDKMGHTSQLSEREIDALEAYVSTL